MDALVRESERFMQTVPRIRLPRLPTQIQLTMLIRLTNPQALDRLIEYLEKDRGLVWPQLATREPFRDWKIRTIKEEMQSDIIFLEVNWAFNPETLNLECSVCSRPYREILTDEEYLKEDDENENNRN